MITVARTAPLLTVQDAGRTGFLASGVTPSGPLDPLALAVANALVGNAPNAAALEGCLGGAELVFDDALEFAITGADAEARLNDVPVACYRTHRALAGSVLTIARLVRGAVWYLGVRGGIDVPVVLGSRATLLSAQLGGLDGGPVRAGARLATASDVIAPPMVLGAPPVLRAPLDDRPIPLAAGPREDALTDEEWAAVFASTFAVSRASSRVGYRLDGPAIPARFPADLASEPACAGAVQLPPEGQPIVLMADHPTIGGYPMIAVVPSYARGWLAQRMPGDAVRLARIGMADAVGARRRERAEFDAWRR